MPPTGQVEVAVVRSLLLPDELVGLLATSYPAERSCCDWR